MTFGQRLRFYGFGFALGLLVVYAMFGTRSCETPGEVKLAQLVNQYMAVSKKADCQLKCLHRNEALMRIELRHFHINYDKSDVHGGACGRYYVEPREGFAKEHPYALNMYDCDTITMVSDIVPLGGTACECR